VLSFAAAVTLATGGALFGAAAPASAARADDTATVCSRVSKSNEPLRDALNTQVDTINNLTQSGDKAGAAAAAKQLGTTMQTWVTEVQQAASTASDTNLKTALTTAATDSQTLSQQLAAYDGTQKISLDQFGTDNMQINTLCGFTTMAPASPSVQPS